MLRSAEALAERVATVMRAAVDEVVAERGSCTVALSRPTPQVVFRRVNEVGISHAQVHLFQVDERIPGPDPGVVGEIPSPQRARKLPNTPDLNRTLIEHNLPRWVDAGRFHPIPVGDASNVQEAAERYAEELESVCGSPPVLDVVHLGLGTDGHTASLLPDDPVLDVTDRSVWFTSPHGGLARVTLTYPALSAARLIVFVVSGAEKAAALQGVLADDRSLPAARLEAVDIRFYVDAPAARAL